MGEIKPQLDVQGGPASIMGATWGLPKANVWIFMLLTIYLDKEQYQISNHSMVTFSLKSENIWQNLPLAQTLTYLVNVKAADRFRKNFKVL